LKQPTKSTAIITISTKHYFFFLFCGNFDLLVDFPSINPPLTPELGAPNGFEGFDIADGAPKGFVGGTIDVAPPNATTSFWPKEENPPVAPAELTPPPLPPKGMEPLPFPFPFPFPNCPPNTGVLAPNGFAMLVVEPNMELGAFPTGAVEGAPNVFRFRVVAGVLPEAPNGFGLAADAVVAKGLAVDTAATLDPNIPVVLELLAPAPAEVTFDPKEFSVASALVEPNGLDTAITLFPTDPNDAVE